MDENCVEVAWRKSSLSGGSDPNCVEVAWRKSSLSGSELNCVEVAKRQGVVAFRDSKNPDGPYLQFSGPPSMVKATAMTIRPRPA